MRSRNGDLKSSTLRIPLFKIHSTKNERIYQAIWRAAFYFECRNFHRKHARFDQTTDFEFSSCRSIFSSWIHSRPNDLLSRRQMIFQILDQIGRGSFFISQVESVVAFLNIFESEFPLFLYILELFRIQYTFYSLITPQLQ